MPARTPPDVEAEIIRQYTSPLPDGTWKGSRLIARDIGVSDMSVLNILRRAGVSIRTGKEAHSGGKQSGPVKYPERYRPSPVMCACGCGVPTKWSRKINSWAKYAAGHYRKDAPYKDADWLRREYIDKRRSVTEMASDCGVNQTTVIRFMEKHGIPRRDASASKIGRFEGERNPAWKGGVSKWEYAPNWKRIARIIRRRDNYTCQICQQQFEKQSKLLHIHHIDGDKTNNDPSNLVAVCATCHPRGKRAEKYNRACDPGFRKQWLVSRKGEVLGFDADTYVVTREAAVVLRVSTGHIANMIQDGRLAGKKTGGFWYVERASLECLAATYRNPRG